MWSGAPVVREEFDPQSLNDDDFLIQPPDEGVGAPKPRSAGTQLPSSEPKKKTVQADRPIIPAPAQEMSGAIYRVQVAAVATAERAEEVRRETEQAIGVSAYIQHDPPLYKIQAGDFRLKAEAENFLKTAQGKGYIGAFLVSVSGVRPKSPPPEARASESPSGAATQKGEDKTPAVQMVPAQGYRVQIFSVTDRGEAQRFYEEARRRLNREDIYLQFEPPFFRVRVGNCRTRDAAEDLVRELEQGGYEAPFPVRTQILVPEATRPKNE